MPQGVFGQGKAADAGAAVEQASATDEFQKVFGGAAKDAAPAIAKQSDERGHLDGAPAEASPAALDGGGAMIGVSGNDLILGGPGVDHAMLFGHASRWEIQEIGPNQFAVTNRSTGEQDILLNVELKTFDNGTFHLSTM